MTSHQPAVLPRRRRRELLETAAAEFIAHGYQRASLNRIIAAHRMSKSSFYHYFASKEALFDTVVTQIGQDLVASLDMPDPATLGRGDFWAEVASIMRRLTEMAGDDSPVDLARLFYLPDAPAGSAVCAVREAIDDWVNRALMAGRIAGTVRDDLPAELQNRLVMAVLWTMDEWTVSHLPEMDSARMEQLAKAQLDAVRRLLDPRL